jgi:glycosyltransferase involved in cell wall biosynthesis
MTEEALQIDFRPQPRGIAVVTSAPISVIAESGNYAAFQDLIDGYASSFATVHVFSPNGDSVVKPVKGHRVSWHSGPRWLSPMNGLWWTVLANRREFENIELVRTFGPRAGVVGKALSKLSRSPHVSSSDDLIGNTWRDRTGWKSTPTKVINRIGVLRANMLAATLEWELEYLSESGYDRDLLIGRSGLATDIYTPVGATDPARHPVVLWAGPVDGDDSIDFIAQAAIETKAMIDGVEFVVVTREDEAENLRTDVAGRDLPVTIAAFDQVEPLVDLIERTWACVATPSNGLPHGMAMFAASAGIPIVSLGELEEKHGFKNHVNYMGVETDDHRAVAYALQLLRRWSTWSLRIGSAGQQLIEERYSTKTVAIREGEQLARIARGEELKSDSPVQQKTLSPYTSPATGEKLPFVVDAELGEGSEADNETDYFAAGFDLVAAALAELSGTTTSAVSTPTEAQETNDDMGQDAISALFAADNEGIEAPNAEPVDLPDGDLDQDAISALFAASESDPGPEPVNEPEPSGDLDQDAISALFAANEPDPAPEPMSEPEPSGDLDQDAISALFAANEPDPAPEPMSEPEPSGVLDQDAISTLFAANELDPAPEPVSEPEPSGVLDQDAISALFAANEPDPTPEPMSEPEESGDLGQDAISALFEFDEAPAPGTVAESADTAMDTVEEDFVSAILEAKESAPGRIVTSEELEDDLDLPNVNAVKLNNSIEPEEDDEAAREEFESIDVDPELIASILEGKDVDP